MKPGIQKQPAGFEAPAGFVISFFFCITLSLQTGVSAARAPAVTLVPAEIEAVAGTEGAAVQAVPVVAWVLRKEAPNAVLRVETEVRRMRAPVVVAEVAVALHTAAAAEAVRRVAAEAEVRHTEVQVGVQQVAAWALHKEAPNVVLRAETEVEVRRMRARVVAGAGAHIEASRHPARIG